MKKLMCLTLAIAFALVLVSPVMASVDVRRSKGATVEYLGAIDTIEVGNAATVAGNVLVLGYTYIDGGVSTMVSSPRAVPVTYKTVHMDLTNGNTITSTLAAGVNGQVLTLDVTVNPSAAYVWTITPASATGYTTLTLGHVGSYVTLLYVNGTYGWIVIDQKGATIA